MTTATITETDYFRIVEDACTFSSDRSSAKIVVEAKEKGNFGLALEALDGIEPKNLAIGYAAANGVADPRLNGIVGSGYAVNKDGIELEKVYGPNQTKLPASHPDKQPAAYRVDVPLVRKLV